MSAGARNATTRARIAIAVLLVVAASVPIATVASAQAPPAPRPGSTKIIGGTLAPPGSWPSQVGLLDSGEPDNYQAQFCGGTVVSPSWVLTAAHCVFGDDGAKVPAAWIDILVGTQSLVTGGTRIRADEIRVVPGYDAGLTNRDLAMIHLSSPTKTPVQALIAPNAGVAAGTNVTATGWGTTVEGENSYPYDLQQVTMKMQADSQCRAAYGPYFFPSNMSCAQAIGKDTCQGDSGGPLVTKQGSTWVQVGITSWGEGCANPGYPGISTRLATFTSWVRDQIEYYPHADASGLVTATYRDLFNRAPTPTELYGGVVTLNGPTTAAGWVRAQTSGATYQARMGGLARSYSAYFLRDPDQSGLAFWFPKVNAGWTTARVSNFFAESSEFVNRYGSLSNGAFVDLVYTNVLGRPADAGGRTYWVGQLDAGRKTRGQVMVGYSESNEYQSATRTRVDVIITTFALLRRAPTSVEISEWSTLSGEELIKLLLAAGSYTSRY